MPLFSGTFTALITPFRNGQIDYDALEKLVERQIQGGVDGLVPCGTTGESPTLTDAEYREVVGRVARAVKKRVPVVAGAGSNSTAKTLHYAHDAAECGADGLMLVSPYYNKPTQAGLFQHFSAVARETKLPILLYNIPGRCGVEISVDTLRRLREAHANIVAVKHATGKVEGASDLLQVCDLAVLSGDDPLTLPLMSVGAVGVVSVLSNLAPKAVKRLTQAALNGDFQAALAAHRALYALAQGLLSLETNPIPIKTALALRGFCAEEFRLPMCPMQPENRQKLQRLLEQNALE